jgi:hypothetical protein
VSFNLFAIRDSFLLARNSAMPGSTRRRSNATFLTPCDFGLRIGSMADMARSVSLLLSLYVKNTLQGKWRKWP